MEHERLIVTINAIELSKWNKSVDREREKEGNGNACPIHVRHLKEFPFLFSSCYFLSRYLFLVHADANLRSNSISLPYFFFFILISMHCILD